MVLYCTRVTYWDAAVVYALIKVSIIFDIFTSWCVLKHSGANRIQKCGNHDPDLSAELSWRLPPNNLWVCFFFISSLSLTGSSAAYKCSVVSHMHTVHQYLSTCPLLSIHLSKPSPPLSFRAPLGWQSFASVRSRCVRSAQTDTLICFGIMSFHLLTHSDSQNVLMLQKPN